MTLNIIIEAVRTIFSVTTSRKFLQIHHPTAFFLLPLAPENVGVVPRASAEGSSSVQTLGGMSGAIIVEDPEGSLPPEVEPMREVVMVLQETNIESGEEETAGLSSSERRGCF